MVSDFNPFDSPDEPNEYLEKLVDKLSTMKILITGTDQPFCNLTCDQLHMHGFENITSRRAAPRRRRSPGPVGS